MKALVFLTVGVFAICISGCNSVKNEGNVSTSSITSKNVKGEAVVEDLPIVKHETRPLRPIGKRTVWTLDDVDLVEGMVSSDTTKNNPLLKYLSEYEHAAP